MTDHACALAAALIAALILAPAGAQAAEGDAAHTTQRRITSSEAYVPTATLSAAITHDYQFAGLLVVDAGFDIPDAKLRADVVKMGPRITDALRTGLAEYTYSRYHSGAAPDPDRIETMLQQAANQAIGRPGARLLLSNVMVQRGR
jgi:hypothetical protein